ncbi:MAG: DUF262 domain-containing protein [Gallionella sp.]|nr:DUF262 domain-containing protein [Gallionella sp.]
MSERILKKEEEDSFFVEDHDQPLPPDDVVAYNELRSCADLFRMYKNGKLEIQPDFQREVVWKQDERSRFIDSLVKQLPIPSMCFSLDAKTQSWKVIDGLQRMSSIISFLGDAPWSLSAVDDIHPLLKNRSNVDLRKGSEEDKRLYSSVEDMSIPITVIRCDYSVRSHMRYLFMIFNRLNSGGVRLNNQEIRNCIFSGKYNDMLKKFDADNREWQLVKKKTWGSMSRFRSVEILLRALAFADNLERYNGNLAGFLNDFMDSATKYDQSKIDSTREALFFMASSAFKIVTNLPSGKKSLTFMEGLLVALVKNHERLRNIEDGNLRTLLGEKALAYVSLPSFTNVQRYALSSESIVKTRLREAISLFASE